VAVHPQTRLNKSVILPLKVDDDSSILEVDLPQCPNSPPADDSIPEDVISHICLTKRRLNSVRSLRPGLLPRSKDNGIQQKHEIQEDFTKKSL
jgi:hypothetical protein